MAIEPISSIMTIQAQGSVNANPKQPVASERPEVVEASAASQEAAKVDSTIRSIENAQEKGNTGNDKNEGKEQTASQEQLRKAVDEMNKNLANSEAIFGFHDKTNRVTIKIVDKTTKKVIKELPPEKTLDMIARVWDMAGILVDEKR